MDNAQAQLADKLKSASNVLVTVSRNPSVDQLAALLGLTLVLNKLGKHTAAVFSGQVPSTIEFLKPEETFEKNTDSLRDFIIALDKSKADKLRYKVENDVVRIFITPYKTSITQDDLEFSQGDFNVDVVVALGVKQQEDLDQAITVHGRILHDATVASINITPDGGLGSISWHQPDTSSLSELVTDLAQGLGEDLLDNQIATALLTGIVAETDRFSNDKTTSKTMSTSALLMAAGANQQLVATQLNAPGNANHSNKKTPKAHKADDEGSKDETPAANHDGTLEITHDKSADKPDAAADETPLELPTPLTDVGDEEGAQLNLPSDTANLPDLPELPASPPPPDAAASSSRIMSEPPSLGGTLTANSQPEGLDPVTDPLSMPKSEQGQLLSRTSPTAPGTDPLPPPVASDQSSSAMPPLVPFSPTAATDDSAADSSTMTHSLSDLEKSVDSAHDNTVTHLDAARDEVSKALSGADTPQPPEAIQALGAQPMVDNLHGDQSSASSVPSLEQQIPGLSTTIQPADDPVADPPANDSQTPATNDDDASKPPPVPPPMPFQFGQSH